MNTSTKLKILQLLLVWIIPVSGYVSDFLGIDLQFLFYITLLYTLFYACYVLVKRKGSFFRRYRTEVYLAVILLLGQLVNRDLFSINRGVSGLLDLFIFLGGCIMYAGDEDTEEVGRSLRRMFAGTAAVTFVITFVSLLVGTYCRFTGLPFLSLSGEQLEIWIRDYSHFVFGGYYRNSNQMGLNAFVSLCLSLYLLEKKQMPKVFLWLNIAVQLIGIVFSGCRSVFLGLIVFALIFALGASSRKLRRYAGLITLVFGGLGVAATVYKMTMFSQGFGAGDVLNALTGNRSILWKECVDLFRLRPSFGVGLNNIHPAAELLDYSTLIRYRTYTNAHNNIINIISMTGITGIIGFAALAKKLIYSSRKLDRILRCFIIGILFADLFDIFVLFTDKISTWAVAALLGYAYAQYKHADKVYLISNLVAVDQYRKIYTKAEKPGQQAQKFNRLIAEGFRDQGYDITCLSSVLASPAIVDYKVKKLPADGMYRYHLSMAVPGVKNLYHLFSAFFGVLVHRPGCYLIDVLSIDDGIGTLLACRLAGIPSIGVITDLPEHFTDSRFYARLFYGIVKLCDAYVFLTEYMDAKLNPKHKPYIVMEGLCDIREEPQRHAQRTGDIIFAGELDEANGTLTLADGYLGWEEPQGDLLFYGSGEALPALAERAQKQPKIRIMGTVLNAELMPILQNASLLMNPRPIHQDFVKYSFPSKLMEYMNTGTFTASSRLACIPEEYFEVIGDLGEGSAQDILKFLHVYEKMTPEEKEEKGRQAREFVRTYKNNHVQTARIMELMKGLK